MVAMVKFGTKAETLERLRGKCSHASVLPLVYFSVGEWYSSASDVWEKVSAMEADEWIVRSSALNEDTAESSQAGKFDSIGHVHGKTEFEHAVEAVISSFKDENLDNQVLVQPMLQGVRMCEIGRAHV